MIPTSMKVLAGIFVLLSLLDIGTTIAGHYVHSEIFDDLEINLLFAAGVPFWGVIVFYACARAYLVYSLLMTYPRMGRYVRFTYLYVFNWVLIVSFFVVLNNFAVLQVETDDIRTFDTYEQKVQAVTSAYTELNVARQFNLSIPMIVIAQNLLTGFLYIRWQKTICT